MDRPLRTGGHHAFVASGVSMPSIHQVSNHNGQSFPVMRCTTQAVDIAGPELSTPFTAIIVDRYNSSSRGGRTLHTPFWYLGKYDGTNTFYVSDSSSSTEVGPSPAASRNLFEISTGTIQGNIVNHYVDGVQIGVPGFDNGFTPGKGKLALTKANPGADIACVLIWDRVLTDNERQTVEKWLGAKYGIGVNHSVDLSAIAKKYVAAVDLGVSRAGKLAQVPDIIPLPHHVSADPGGAGSEALRGEITHLEADIPRLETEIDTLNTDIATLTSQISTAQPEFEKIPQLIHHIGEIKLRLKSGLSGQERDNYQKGLRELEDRLSRLRQELAAQSTPHAQRYAKNIQLRNKREELNKKSAKLTQLLQLQFGIPSSQPMRLFHTDPRGLTVSSGLLGFAYTDSQSYLFESALGRMAIYFKGANKQFFSAYYDVNTARARWSLAAGSGSLTLVSRATDSQVNDTSIVVANGTDADHCVVTIGNAKTGLTETWNDIPREASAFAQVLNGEAGEKSFVGKLKTSLSGAAITTIDLKDGLPREVPAGSTLLVEDSSSGSKQTSRLIITAKADSGAKQITITSATPTLAADAKVYLLLYDYASKASSNRSGYTLDNGNLMINVVVGSVKGKVGNATASRTTEAQSPQWTADAPGSALYFDGTNDYLPGTPPNNFEHEGDITLEAWVRPLDFTGDTRLIHCKSGASHYSLGLRQTPVNSALSLDGTGDYVALPAASKLGLTNNDFTVESWIKVNFAATGHKQTILGNVGGGSHTALHLVIRNDKPYLGFHGNELADPTVLTKGTWYHLAFRYTAATKEQAIFVNGDKTSHRAAPAHYSGTGNL